MKLYVQYDPADGFITGTVLSSGAPSHPSQLEFPIGTCTHGKKVDLETYELVEASID